MRQLKAVGAVKKETVSFQEFLQEKLATSPELTSPFDGPGTETSSGLITPVTRSRRTRAGLAITRWVGIDTVAFAVQLFARIRIWLNRVLVGFCEVGVKLGIVGPVLSRWAKEQRRDFVKMATLSQTRKWLDVLLDVHAFEIFTMIPSCFNGDPHPGNIIAMPDGRLGLIDY